jgi:pimeloyl-ACP methyl ester carboxylesterase
MSKHFTFCIGLWLACTGTALCQTLPRLQKQQQYLDELLRVLPKSEPWENWLREKKQLPPDFEAMPSVPYLPDPLKNISGKMVTREEWPKRRQELLLQFQQYVLGTFPPSPGNVHAASVKSREEPGCFIDEVLLEFGPAHKAKLRMELLIPKGQGPFPVFITQDNHRSWALVAVSRGYIGCIYAGADTKDDTAAWTAVWPEYDWTKLTRRAWAASRCIDYLQSLDVVDKAKIALTGHSRNGKTSLIGAAIDQRVAAVISSSSGAGGACSYRFFSEAQFGEGIEMITRSFPDWLHPRLRFFVGRENKLPVDQPELIACIAPRACLISSALNDSVESIYAVEQSFYSARRAYELLGKPDELNLLYRPGGHETKSEDIERYVDWLDAVFGRVAFNFPDNVIYPTYAQWLKVSGEQIDPSRFPTNRPSDFMKGIDGATMVTAEDWGLKRRELRNRVSWGLGDSPSYAQGIPGKYGSEAQSVAMGLNRATVPNGLQKQGINFGNYVAGDLYFPTNADKAGKKLPVVIWLHPVSVSNGYVPGYRRGEQPHLAMARLGCAVLAFDQIGNGSRVEEVRSFFYRYPHWSLLGKMVEDTLAAVEALQQIDFIDSQRIFLVGYGTGGMTAMHAAALDEKIAGVISIAGFAPMRTDTRDTGTGGVARWAHWMPLQPRLGNFVGHEDQIPYDYEDLLAMIAPRPVYVFQPKIGYQVDPKELASCMQKAVRVFDLFGARDRLRLFDLEDYNRFSPESQQIVYEQLKMIAGLPGASKQ